MDHINFVLAQLRISSSPAFPALVLDNEAVVPVDAILPLAARLGYALSEPQTLDGLLRNWDHNFAGLRAVVAALNDKTEGKYFRSAISSIRFFTADCPLSSPRQIISQNTLGAGEMNARLASTLVGPAAKILIPAESDGLWAEVKIGLVIARPLFQATPEAAAQAIAGFVTVADYTIAKDWQAGRFFAAKQSPTLLSVGPYFVPTPFADAQDSMMTALPVNGVDQGGFSGAKLPAFGATLAAISHDVQLFPGDLVCLGPAAEPATLMLLGDGDIIETAVSSLGRQTTNTIMQGNR